MSLAGCVAAIRAASGNTLSEAEARRLWSARSGEEGRCGGVVSGAELYASAGNHLPQGSRSNGHAVTPRRFKHNAPLQRAGGEYGPVPGSRSFAVRAAHRSEASAVKTQKLVPIFEVGIDNMARIERPFECEDFLGGEDGCGCVGHVFSIFCCYKIRMPQSERVSKYTIWLAAFWRELWFWHAVMPTVVHSSVIARIAHICTDLNVGVRHDRENTLAYILGR